MPEKEYKDFNASAVRGIKKYASLSSRMMVKYQNMYEKKTGRIANHIDNKEHFYSWVSRNRIR